MGHDSLHDPVDNQEGGEESLPRELDNLGSVVDIQIALRQQALGLIFVGMRAEATSGCNDMLEDLVTVTAL